MLFRELLLLYYVYYYYYIMYITDPVADITQ